MAERIDAVGLNLEEHIVDIWRCSKVVKGGRRFSFAAMTVVGDANGIVGVGYGKAREVPGAIEKAVKNARKNLQRVPLHGTTIPHEVRGRYGSARVVMLPARPGTGIIAGVAVRLVLESIGVRDVLTKSVGKTSNKKNLVRAAVEGLLRLRGRADVSGLRGVEVPDDPQLAENLKARVDGRREAYSSEQHASGRSRPRGAGPRRGRRPPAPPAPASRAPAVASASPGEAKPAEPDASATAAPAAPGTENGKPAAETTAEEK